MSNQFSRSAEGAASAAPSFGSTGLSREELQGILDRIADDLERNLPGALEAIDARMDLEARLSNLGIRDQDAERFLAGKSPSVRAKAVDELERDVQLAGESLPEDQVRLLVRVGGPERAIRLLEARGFGKDASRIYVRQVLEPKVPSKRSESVRKPMNNIEGYVASRKLPRGRYMVVLDREKGADWLDLAGNRWGLLLTPENLVLGIKTRDIALDLMKQTAAGEDPTGLVAEAERSK